MIRKALRLVAWSVAAIVGVALLLGLYGIAVEPRLLLDEQSWEARVPSLPPAWDGRRIAVMGDFQVGLWLDNTGALDDAVARVVEEQPAALLLTGDFVYHSVTEEPEDEREALGEVVEALRPLASAGVPTFAVLGNHDWSLAHRDSEAVQGLAERVERSLEGIGVRVLHNEAVELPGDGTLYLVGIGSRWAGRDHVEAALDRVPDDAARLALMHHPDSFARFPAGTAPLAVAGHTHGGQVRLPGLPDWSWLTYAKEDDVHADGWISGFGEPGNALYVNRGIGMSLAPVRFNCRPELTWLTLRRSAGSAGGPPREGGFSNGSGTRYTWRPAAAR